MYDHDLCPWWSSRTTAPATQVAQMSPTRTKGAFSLIEDAAIDRKYHWQNLPNRWAIWFGLPRPFP
jgi:hypothetical protein